MGVAAADCTRPWIAGIKLGFRVELLMGAAAVAEASSCEREAAAIARRSRGPMEKISAGSIFSGGSRRE